jgi:predicted MFS family arabinose efflux permease
MLRTVDLLILSIGTFTLGVDGFVRSGLLPQVAASLHVSASTAGQLTTLFALVYAVSSPVIAALAGAWDRRALLAVAVLTPVFLIIAYYLPAIMRASGTWIVVALGFSAGLAIVPQQHRLFAVVPRLAPVAVSLNGSGIYIATALGAAVGGAVLAAGGSAAPAVTAAIIGLLAIAGTTTAVRRA